MLCNLAIIYLERLIMKLYPLSGDCDSFNSILVNLKIKAIQYGLPSGGFAISCEKSETSANGVLDVLLISGVP